MPVDNHIADVCADVTAWRHHLHAHPELLYEVHQTAEFVASKLKSFGCDEIVTRVGQTGVVGVIRGNKPARTGQKAIGLRADMDALPIQEMTPRPYASTVPGRMHACGHDGHTAMLLGAARCLAETRDFGGTAVVIFQPAEEGGAGAKAMLDDRLFERFDIGEVYGMHNRPGMAVGEFGIGAGVMMAASDQITIDIEGLGGHAARPHLAVDSVLVGAQIINAIQSVVSRNVDPLKAAVVSICVFEAGNANNVLPQRVQLRGTARSLTADIRDLLEQRLHSVVEGTAAAFGASANLTYTRNYPVLCNHSQQAEFAASVAAAVVGDKRVDIGHPPMMAGEDFAFMLQARAGAFIWLGNGVTAELHHPAYDFNDDAIPYGMSYWIRLVETALTA